MPYETDALTRLRPNIEPDPCPDNRELCWSWTGPRNTISPGLSRLDGTPRQTQHGMPRRAPINTTPRNTTLQGERVTVFQALFFEFRNAELPAPLEPCGSRERRRHASGDPSARRTRFDRFHLRAGVLCGARGACCNPWHATYQDERTTAQTPSIRYESLIASDPPIPSAESYAADMEQWVNGSPDNPQPGQLDEVFNAPGYPFAAALALLRGLDIPPAWRAILPSVP